MRAKSGPFRQVGAKAAPLSWPLVERRQADSPGWTIAGVDRRRSPRHPLGTGFEPIPINPFRLAAVVAAVVRASVLFRQTDRYLVIAAIVVVGYTMFIIRNPIPTDAKLGDSRYRVVAEQVLIVGAVLVTDAWNSPLAFFLIPTAMVAAFVAGSRFATILTVASAIVISVQHVRSLSFSEALQPTGLWTGFLGLVAVVAGFARKTAVESAGQQKEVLDRVGKLSVANALLSSLHRVSQELPASLDLDDVLDSTISTVRNLIPNDTITILLLNEATGALEPARAIGFAGEAALCDPFQCPPLAEAMQQSEPLKRDYLLRKQGYAPISVSPNAQSGLYASLRARGSIVGVIALEAFEQRHFTAQQVEILKGLAEPLGIAVDNAHLFHKLRIVGADEERNRIARDLHDRVGSSLASLGYAIDGSIAASRRGLPVGDDLSEIRNQVTGMISEVREALYDLRSDVNDDQDLPSTLRQFVDRVKARSGLVATFTSDQQMRLSIPQEREFWQIAREAIVNVERHAQATSLQVDWICNPASVLLTIHDNGIGLQSGAGRTDSYGMVGMRERAESIDALLTTDTSLGGTIIRVELRRPRGN